MTLCVGYPVLAAASVHMWEMAVLMVSCSFESLYLCMAFSWRFVKYSLMCGILRHWCSGSPGVLYGTQKIVLKHLFRIICSFSMYFGCCSPRRYPVSITGRIRLKYMSLRVALVAPQFLNSTSFLFLGANFCFMRSRMAIILSLVSSVVPNRVALSVMLI